MHYSQKCIEKKDAGDFPSRRSSDSRASRDVITCPSLSLSLSLSLEFSFNCDTSSGLWRTAYPVISRHYSGMREQAPGSINVRPVHGTAPSPLPLVDLEIRSPCAPLDRPDATRGFFPLACSTLRGSRSLADRDANHSIIALPRGARIKPVQPPPPPPSSSWHGRSLFTRKSRLSSRDPIESGTEREGNAVCETVKNTRFRRKQPGILI